MSRFSGSVAVVTGASEGIGLAIARRLADEGANVAVCGRRKDVLTAAAKTIGEKCIVAQELDVSNYEELADFIRAVAEKNGRLDSLVNNAMHVGWSAISDTTLEDFRKDFQVNVDAAFIATKAAMAFMTAQQSGSIVNIASINGLLAIDNMAAYSASKAALIHFSNCAAMEGALNNVRVNVIAPGVVATPSTTGALGGIEGYTDAVAGGVPMGRLGQPEEVAAVAAFLLSDESSYVTGTCLSVDGGKATQLMVPPPPSV